MRSFTYLEHASDEGVEARGATRAEAYEAAAEGLVEMIASRIMLGETEQRECEISAPDEAALLVRLLNRILFWFDADHYLPRSCRVRFPQPLVVVCTMFGQVVDPDALDPNMCIKAVTYHQLAIAHDDAGWVIRYFVDV